MIGKHLEGDIQVKIECLSRPSLRSTICFMSGVIHYDVSYGTIH